MENDLNEILQYLDKITNIYSRISDLIISNDYKNKFNDTVIKYKYNFDKILKKDLPLKVCVVGTMKTGKSEFINSLIKEKLLATNVIPMTKKVTVFKYSEEFKIFKIYNDKTREEISKIEHKILSNHKVDNVKDEIELNIDTNIINYFEVHYPADILKNINIADTPGFFSSDPRDDELTKEWIKKAECLIWMFNPNTQINVEEKILLNDILSKNIKIIPVVNRMDRIKKIDKAKVLEVIKNEFNFHSVIPYSAQEICKFETIIKGSGDILNNILNEAKNSLLYGNNQNDRINPGSLLIVDDRINKDLIESLKKHDLESEYMDYKNKVKLVLREVKKDPVNIKSDVLYKKAYEVLKKESKDLTYYKQEIESIIEYEKKEILDYRNLTNKILNNSDKYLEKLSSDIVIQDTAEDIMDNCFNSYCSGKSIEIDDMISNRMLNEFVLAVLKEINLDFKDQVNQVKINVILIEYINTNIESIFNPIISKIVGLHKKEKNNNPFLFKFDYFKNFRSVFYELTSGMLYHSYKEIFNGFINYYVNNYILHEIKRRIESNEIINKEIDEILKES